MMHMLLVGRPRLIGVPVRAHTWCVPTQRKIFIVLEKNEPGVNLTKAVSGGGNPPSPQKQIAVNRQSPPLQTMFDGYFCCCCCCDGGREMHGLFKLGISCSKPWCHLKPVSTVVHDTHGQNWHRLRHAKINLK